MMCFLLACTTIILFINLTSTSQVEIGTVDDDDDKLQHQTVTCIEQQQHHQQHHKLCPPPLGHWQV